MEKYPGQESGCNYQWLRRKDAGRSATSRAGDRNNAVSGGTASSDQTVMSAKRQEKGGVRQNKDKHESRSLEMTPVPRPPSSSLNVPKGSDCEPQILCLLSRLQKTKAKLHTIEVIIPRQFPYEMLK